jgi:Chaperone of endosialidase
MASITTRETGTTGTNGVTRKNLPLTNAEIDNNFINLNNNKLETSNNLSDVASASTSRTNLGLGTIATQASNSVSITGGSISGITDLAVADGGTGLSSSGGSGFLLIGNSSNTFTAATLTGTANRVTVTNGSGSITISAPQDIASSSNVQFGSLGIGTAASGTSGEIRATNQITSYYSDERLKEDIVEIQDALEKVMSLRGVTYKPNSIAESLGYKKQNEVGVIAQDVEKVLPEAVKPAPFDIMLFENTEISKSGQNYKTVQYEKIVPLLIEAIKELNKEVQQLKGK